MKLSSKLSFNIQNYWLFSIIFNATLIIYFLQSWLCFTECINLLSSFLKFEFGQPSLSFITCYIVLYWIFLRKELPIKSVFKLLELSISSMIEFIPCFFQYLCNFYPNSRKIWRNRCMHPFSRSHSSRVRVIQTRNFCPSISSWD